MTRDFCLVDSAPRHDVSVEWQIIKMYHGLPYHLWGTKRTNLTKYYKISNRLLFMLGVLIFVLHNSYTMYRCDVAQTCVGFGIARKLRHSAWKANDLEVVVFMQKQSHHSSLNFMFSPTFRQQGSISVVLLLTTRSFWWYKNFPADTEQTPPPLLQKI